MFSCYTTNNQNKTHQNSFFLRNGAAVLEQTIRLFNGKSNPIRTYSSRQLKRATHNFHFSRLIFEDAGYKMYKGVDEEEDRQFSVKVFLPEPNKELYLKMIAKDVAVASMMSNHRNVLKLLGYCLDTELPMLVYELPVHGNLSHFLDKNDGLPFQTKLNIGIGIANAVAYLHHGHLKTLVHRDIHPKQVYLDQDYGAKLFDFGASLPIQEGKTHVDAEPCGTIGYMPLEAALWGRYSERSDVYSFGILLFELLTGKNFGQLLWDENSTADKNDIVDAWKRELKANLPKEKEEERGQIMECAKLVESCVKEDVDCRPNMVEVAKALVCIKTNNTRNDVAYADWKREEEEEDKDEEEEDEDEDKEDEDEKEGGGGQL